MAPTKTRLFTHEKLSFSIGYQSIHPVSKLNCTLKVEVCWGQSQLTQVEGREYTLDRRPVHQSPLLTQTEGQV